MGHSAVFCDESIQTKKGQNDTSLDLLLDGKRMDIASVTKDVINYRNVLGNKNKQLSRYNQLEYVNEKAGIKNSHVDESFKEKFLQETTIANNNVTSFLDAISKSDNSIIVSGDSSDGEYYSIWDLKASKSLAKKIDPSKGMIIQSFPQSTSDGIKFKSLPVVNYKVGMLISIDNAYRKLPERTKKQVELSHFLSYLPEMLDIFSSIL